MEQSETAAGIMKLFVIIAGAFVLSAVEGNGSIHSSFKPGPSYNCKISFTPRQLGGVMEESLRGDGEASWKLYWFFMKLKNMVWANRFLYMSALEGYRSAMETIEARTREQPSFADRIFIDQPESWPSMDMEVALAYRPSLLPFYWLSMNYRQRGDAGKEAAMRPMLVQQGISRNLIDNKLVYDSERGLVLETPFPETKAYLEQEFQTPEEEKRMRELQRQSMMDWPHSSQPFPAMWLIHYYKNWSGRKNRDLAGFWSYVDDLMRSVPASAKKGVGSWRDHDYAVDFPFVENKRTEILQNLDKAETYLIYALYVRDMQTGREENARCLLPILQQRGVSPWLWKARIVRDAQGRKQIAPMPGVPPMALADFRKPVEDLKGEEIKALSGDTEAAYRLFWHYDSLPGGKRQADQWLYVGALKSKSSIWPDIERTIRERDVPLETLMELPEETVEKLDHQAESGKDVEAWSAFLMYRHYAQKPDMAKSSFWWKNMPPSVTNFAQFAATRRLAWNQDGKLEIRKLP